MAISAAIVPPIGTYQGVFKSSDGHAWTKLDGSPGGSDGLNGDGVRIFTGMRDSGQNQLPFFAAPASKATPWTSLPGNRVAPSRYGAGHSVDDVLGVLDAGPPGRPPGTSLEVSDAGIDDDEVADRQRA